MGELRPYPLQTQKVPTYGSDGRKLRSYSIEAIERLLSLSAIVVRRNRNGKIVCAHFRPQDGANPLLATCNMGQRYSHREHVGDAGARVWAHKRLIQRQDIEELTGIPLDAPEDLDLYLRGIFRGVALSCMTQADPPAAPPKPPAKGKVIPFPARRPAPAASDERKAA